MPYPGAVRPRLRFDNWPPITILGAGNLGLFVAHSLAKRDNKIRLLFRSQEKKAEFARLDRRITLERLDGVTEPRALGVDNASLAPWKCEARLPGLRNLIVTTKTYDTAAALMPIRQYITRNTCVVLLQNGLGVIEEITKSGFLTSFKRRPKFYVGICSHGVHTKGPFHIKHAGKGTILLGRVDASGNASSLPPVVPFALKRLVDAEVLSCRLVDASELQTARLRKLLVNAMINPITALLDVPNGKVCGLDQAADVDLFNGLLSEAVAVLKALPAPTPGTPQQQEQWSEEELRGNVLAVAKSTGANISSMLQDVRAGRRTEIDYINGYIVDMGKKLGIPTETHQKVVSLIKGLEKRKGTDLGATK